MKLPLILNGDDVTLDGDTREQAEKTRREEAIFAKAIELLADYSFDFEPPKAVEPNHTEAASPTTTTPARRHPRRATSP